MQMMEKQALLHFPLHKAPYSNLNGFDLNSKEDWILNPFLRSVSLVSFLRRIQQPYSQRRTERKPASVRSNCANMALEMLDIFICKWHMRLEFMADVAQKRRASDCGSEGREFKALHSPQKHSTGSSGSRALA